VSHEEQKVIGIPKGNRVNPEECIGFGIALSANIVKGDDVAGGVQEDKLEYVTEVAFNTVGIGSCDGAGVRRVQTDQDG
jgi:hypothetical protein